MEDELKNREERILMDHFRRLYPAFPAGKLNKSESPDFILRFSDKSRIGIELTSLAGIPGPGDPFQPDENHKQEAYILSRAARLFSAGRVLPLYLRAAFSEAQEATDPDPEERARQLASWVEMNIQTIDPGLPFCIQLNPDGLSFISQIRILYMPGTMNSLWVVENGSPEITEVMANIQRSISRKEEKIRLYRRKRLGQYWLIIIAHGFRGPASFNLGNHLEKMEIYSSFDRIFLFEPFNQQITSLA